MLIAIDPGVRASGGGEVLAHVLEQALRGELGDASVVLLRHNETFRWVLRDRKSQLRRRDASGMIITGTPIAMSQPVPTIMVLQNRAVFDGRFRSPRRIALASAIHFSSRFVQAVGVAPDIGPAASWVPIGLDPDDIRALALSRDRADELMKFSSPSPFILVPGNNNDYRDLSISFPASPIDDRERIYVGRGTDAPQFLSRLPGNARGLGHLKRADVLTLMRHADAVILTSLAEAYPVTALEAAAFGTPIVATDIPGHRLVLDQLSNVRYFRPGISSEIPIALESTRRNSVDRVTREWWSSVYRISPRTMARRYIDLLLKARR